MTPACPELVSGPLVQAGCPLRRVESLGVAGGWESTPRLLGLAWATPSQPEDDVR